MADLVEHRFRAMGSPARVVADHPATLRATIARLAELEARWSRFLPTSEVSCANTNAGYPTVVSDDTFELFERAQFAIDETKGIFDPLLLRQIESIGYDRPFATMAAETHGLDAIAAGTVESPLCLARNTVRVPADTGFDPGGIGKGLAGDIVVREALAAGTDTIMVELGGDVRVAGTAPTATGWTVSIAHDADGLAELDVSHGGIATSSITRLRWTHNGQPVHHILDPRTGAPAASDIATATVVASELWWAEVATKCALIVGTDQAGELWNRMGVRGCHTLRSVGAA